MSRPQAHLRLFAALALALCAPLSVAGCAGGKLQAETEYAEGVDFSNYTTYRWITEDLVLIQSGTGNERIRNVENEKRIRAAVERELGAKGLKPAEGDAAQLVIAFTVGTKVRYKWQGGGGQGLDIVTADDETVTQGQLTLYLFDGESHEQIWSGWAKKELEPGEDPDTVINTAVALILGAYPPG